MVFYFGVANYVVLDGELVKDFFPYFYARKPIKHPAVRKIERTDYTMYAFDGLSYSPVEGAVYRIEVESPAIVPMLREDNAVAQSVVPFGVRASIDLERKGLGLSADEIKKALTQKPKVVAFDVEVIGKRTIIGYTTGDGITITEDPEDLVALQADYYVGFNSGSFDVRYLKEIAPTKYVFDTPYGYKPHIDLFTIVDSNARSAFGLSDVGSVGLYEVAYQLGLIGADELKMKLKRAHLSSLSEAEIKEYLAKDVEVTYKIAQQWIPLLQALSVVTGISVPAIVQLLEKGTTGLLAEVVFHRELERAGKVYADRRRQHDFEGGDKTRATREGVYENVVELDFSAMYPSTYVQFSVDPAGVRECADGFEVRLKHTAKRICFEGQEISRVLKAFYDFRQVTKKLKKEGFEAADMAAKILANSAYGKFGTWGWGIVNEWAAAFIFQYTDYVFSHLWEYSSKRYVTVYGDTDSLYIQHSDVDKLVAEINTEAKKFGELYELKVEGIWKKFYLFPKEGGGVAEKAYIKAGDKIVIKGAKLRPHNLPRGLRYGGWYKIVEKFVEGENVRKLLEEYVRTAPLEDLFVEKSSTMTDMFYTEDGPKKRLDHMSDVPILFALAAKNGGKLSITPNRKSEIYDVLHIPIRPNEEYIILFERPYVVRGTAKYVPDKLVYVSVTRSPVSEIETRRRALSYLLSVSAVKSLLSLQVPRLV